MSYAGKFEVLHKARSTVTSKGFVFYERIGGRSYVAKTTDQLKHALAVIESTGVELKAAEVVGDGDDGRAAFDLEVQRVRAEASY